MNQSISSRGNTEQKCAKLIQTYCINLAFPFLELHETLVKQYWPQYWCLGYTVSDWPPARLCDAYHNPVSLAAQFSTHLTGHSSRLYFIILSMRTMQEMLSKAFLKLRLNGILCSPIIHHLVLEGYRDGNTCSSLHTNMLIAPSYVWKRAIELFAPSLSQGLWWGWPARSSLGPLSCLNKWLTFALFQSSGTPPSCQWVL